MVDKMGVIEERGAFQLYCGQRSGSEATIHAMQCFILNRCHWTGAALLIDDSDRLHNICLHAL